MESAATMKHGVFRAQNGAGYALMKTGAATAPRCGAVGYYAPSR